MRSIEYLSVICIDSSESVHGGEEGVRGVPAVIEGANACQAVWEHVIHVNIYIYRDAYMYTYKHM